MASRYVMTARRKAALRKAQLASARKRRKGAVRRHLNKKHRSVKTPSGRRLTNGQVYAQRAIGTAGAVAYGYAYGRFLRSQGYGVNLPKARKPKSLMSNSKQRGNPISRARTNRQFKKMVKKY